MRVPQKSSSGAAILSISCMVLPALAAGPETDARRQSRILRVPLQFATIQAGIDEARAGDTVLVANGVYTGPGNVDLDLKGRAIQVRSMGGPEHCTIDCQGTPENPHRGFAFQSGEPSTAVVDGFRIINGATEIGAILDHYNGAAILLNNESSPTIRNCILEYNEAACWGGAICCTNASPTLENLIIRNNIVGDDGGALFAWQNSSPTIINSMIVNNYSGITGGGITSFGAEVAIVSSTIAGNSAWWGSGIYGNNFVTVSNSIIWNNITEGTSEDQVAGSVTVTFSNVEGGYAGESNMDVDPLFVNAAAGDFHLMPGSLLIDTGDPQMAAGHGSRDLDGDPRVVNGVIDIGADEFQISDK